MSWKTVSCAIAALGIIAAHAALVGPAEAGTCMPVSAKGNGKNPAAATTQAQIKLIQKAARFGGSPKNTSTSCETIPGGFICKMSAVVCPK